MIIQRLTNKVVFKKLDNAVLVDSIAFDATLNVLPHPRQVNTVVLTREASVQEGEVLERAYAFNWTKIDLNASGIIATTRAEFILALATDFFFV